MAATFGRSPGRPGTATTPTTAAASRGRRASRTDVDLLELVLRYQAQPVIESVVDDVFRSSRRYTPLNVQNPALPALLGVSANTVQGRLRADSPLVRSGLVCIDTDGDLKALDRLNRLAAAPAGLTDLAALTPGDFAVVHRKAGFLWRHGEPEALADMLRAECDAKPDRPRPIGFRP